MDRFCQGGCYVVVKASDWKAFVEMCDAAGITWGGRRDKVAAYEPAPLKDGRPIRVIVEDGKMRWAPPNALKAKDVPVVGFSHLRPLTELADRAVITSDGREITARLIAGKRTIKTTKATCAPDDTYRFGPGALLAMFRALETEEDRVLAMDLIGNERIKKPGIPNVHDLVRGKKRSADADRIGEALAQALSEAFGTKVIAIRAGTPQRGKSPLMRLVEDALTSGVKEGMKR